MSWRVLLVALVWPSLVFAACSVRQRTVVHMDIVGSTVLVPVAVNGIPGTFILDTGAAQTSVTPDAVGHFGLALDEWAATTMHGVGGLERRRNANPRSVELGGVALHRRSLAQDATLRVATLARSVVEGRRIDGLLGRDFLSLFDLDLDFPKETLALFDVRDCTGRFLPWADTYASIPVQNPAESALVVPLVLDGVTLRALLDSGASRTLVAASGMARLGLGIDRLRRDPSQIASGLGPHTVTMWQHRFRELRIGDETLAQPVFLVAPIEIRPVSDMLLGSDWLMRHRVWISYATNQLFVTR